LLPFDPPGVNPLLGLAERLRFDGAGAHPANLFRANEAGRLQHAEVLHGRRQRHGQRPGQFAHRCRAAAQPLDHGPPCGVCEGVKQPVQLGRLVKHMPNYQDANS
jgi:hypothetical protein